MNHGLALCWNTSPDHLPASLSAPRLSNPEFDGKQTYRTSRAPIITLRFNEGDYVASLWNKAFHHYTRNKEMPFHTYKAAPKLDVEDKWRFIELKFEEHAPWQTRKTVFELPFVLFYTEEKPEDRWLLSDEGYECLIDFNSRCFKKFSLRSFNGKEVNFDLPKFKSSDPFSIYLNRGSCTDGTWHYILSITAYNYKWINLFKSYLKGLCE